MYGALRAVDQHRNAVGVGDPRHLFDRHQRAEHVRHVGDRHHLGARTDQLLEFVDQEVSLIVDRRPFDHRALAFAEEMPRHDVGMVLHDREDDLVAGLDALAAERIGDEVDRLGGIAGEDDLFLAPGIEKCRHFFARAFVGFGRLVGEIMQAAMHVGVLRRVGLVDAIEHRLRLLRRGGVVEIDKRLAIDLRREDRKIRADAVDVIGAVGHCRMHCNPSLSWRAPSATPRPDPSAPRASRHARCLRSPRRGMPGSATLPLRPLGMPRAIR